MEFLSTVPVWLLFIFVFLLRVSDVTLGTVRTVTIVKGYIGLAMVLGFFEVAIWVVVVSQVITRLDESLWLVIAFAGGFAAGNGIGILIERKLALGTVVVRMISSAAGDEIASALRADGRAVTTFVGEGAEGPVTLVYVAVPRRGVPKILRAARQIDPDLFFVIEPAHETSRGSTMRLRAVPHATGWRAVFKKK